MSKVISNLTFNDFGSKSLIKRKLKAYLEVRGLNNYKVSNFPMLISLSLVMLLEDLFTDCIPYIEKNLKTGLYVIENKFLPLVFSKYEFLNKYLKSYNSQIRYDGNLLFNVDKVYKNLEYKVGEKIMVDNEAKNYFNYLLVCIQYDIINLSETIIVYSGKKTFNKAVFMSSLNYLFSNVDLIKRIKLKLDCYTVEMKNNNENDSVVDETETVNETVNGDESENVNEIEDVNKIEDEEKVNENEDDVET